MASIGQSLAGTGRLVEAGIAACWTPGILSRRPVLRPIALASLVSGSLRQGPGIGLAFRLTSNLLAMPVARIARGRSRYAVLPEGRANRNILAARRGNKLPSTNLGSPEEVC